MEGEGKVIGGGGGEWSSSEAITAGQSKSCPTCERMNATLTSHFVPFGKSTD